MNAADGWAEATAIAELERIILAATNEGRTLAILDAGCGDRCALAYPSDADVTGVDVSSELLARNTRLDRRIVADLGEADLGRQRFDVVVCWDVLEHVRDPGSALDNMADALAPDGLLVVKVPNVRSLKGLATKFTPYRSHRWLYRRFGITEEAMPFPTPFSWSLAADPLRSWGRKRGLSLRWEARWEAEIQERLRAKVRLEGRIWGTARRLGGALTFGAVDGRATDFVLVFAAA